MPFSELYFNVDNGYLEGLVRGFKAGILSQADYLNLVQCETLEDLKLHLQSTDYGSFLANEASPLTVSVIDDKLKEKMVVEFRHMRNQSYEPLASFMDFITLIWRLSTSSAPTWEERLLTPCVLFWSLKLTGEPSSSPSTHLAQSCPKRTVPNSFPTVASFTQKALLSWPVPMTMSRSRL
uniref:V-type proton ATPase subunit d 1 n=1 Tax=Astatotilapia calliptera TaxID=8154 RepID=A0AAX7TM87_ASTCA